MSQVEQKLSKLNKLSEDSGVNLKQCQEILLRSKIDTHNALKECKDCLMIEQQRFDSKWTSCIEYVRVQTFSLMETVENTTKCMRQSNSDWNNQIKCIHNVNL